MSRSGSWGTLTAAVNSELSCRQYHLNNAQMKERFLWRKKTGWYLIHLHSLLHQCSDCAGSLFMSTVSWHDSRSTLAEDFVDVVNQLKADLWCSLMCSWWTGKQWKPTPAYAFDSPPTFERVFVWPHICSCRNIRPSWEVTQTFLSPLSRLFSLTEKVTWGTCPRQTQQVSLLWLCFTATNNSLSSYTVL